MNVLFIITGLACGGAEKQLLDVCIYLKNNYGCNVKVISIASNNEIIDEFKLSQIDVQVLPMNGINAFVKLISSIKKFKPDVIHSHMIHANIALALISPFISCKNLFCTSHNIVEGGKIISTI